MAPIVEVTMPTKAINKNDNHDGEGSPKHKALVAKIIASFPDIMKTKDVGTRIMKSSVEHLSYFLKQNQTMTCYLLDFKSEEMNSAKLIQERIDSLNENSRAWIEAKNPPPDAIQRCIKWRDDNFHFIHLQMIHMCRLRYRILTSTELMARPNAKQVSCFRKKGRTEEGYRDALIEIHQRRRAEQKAQDEADIKAGKIVQKTAQKVDFKAEPKVNLQAKPESKTKPTTEAKTEAKSDAKTPLKPKLKPQVKASDRKKKKKNEENVAIKSKSESGTDSEDESESSSEESDSEESESEDSDEEDSSEEESSDEEDSDEDDSDDEESDDEGSSEEESSEEDSSEEDTNRGESDNDELAKEEPDVKESNDKLTDSKESNDNPSASNESNMETPDDDDDEYDGVYRCPIMRTKLTNNNQFRIHRFIDVDFPLAECCMDILFSAKRVKEAGDPPNPMAWVCNGLLVSESVHSLLQSGAAAIMPKPLPVDHVSDEECLSSDNNDGTDKETDGSGPRNDSLNNTKSKDEKSRVAKLLEPKYKAPTKYSYHFVVLDDVLRWRDEALSQLHGRELRFGSDYRPDPRVMYLRFVVEALKRYRTYLPGFEFHPDTESLCIASIRELWETVESKTAQHMLFLFSRHYAIMTYEGTCRYWGITDMPQVDANDQVIENTKSLALALATQM